MGLSRFATRHIKPVLFVTLALCGIGAWLLGSFPVAILPDTTFPRIVVIADAGDRPSRMMEVAVTRPLEEAIVMVPGVSRVRSKTARGSSEVSIDFNWGANMMNAYQLVNARVNEVRSVVPPETKITVEWMNPTIFPIMGLSLRAEGLSPADLWSYANYNLRPRLARLPGVARVVVQGGRVPEIEVTVTPEKLSAFKLSIEDVEKVLTATNVVKSVGRFDRQFQQFQAIVSGELTSEDQIGKIVVAQRGGTPIYLSQLASIHSAVQDRTTIVTAEHGEAVLLNIIRQPDANTVKVVEEVRSELASAKSTLPIGAKMGVWYDQSKLIHEAVASVRDAVLIGAALAVVVLMLFLGNLRATLVTAAIIPATVLITFLLMRIAGLSLNLMTLGALAVAIGLVIDDAIVVVENVFRHQLEGEVGPDAIQHAAAEIAVPMISSTITTVVVFLPLVLVAGVEGAFFSALAITLTIAVMVSLALALLVSPSTCAAFLKASGAHGRHGRLYERLLVSYDRVLVFTLKRRWLVPLAAAAIASATVLLGTRLKSDFMPEMDEGAFILDFWTPPGTSLAESDRLLQQVETILKETPEVESFSRRLGTEMGFFITEPNRGDTAVTLKSKRNRSIDQIMDSIRERINSEIPGMEIEFVQALQDLVGDLAGNPTPIEVKLFGEDLGQLSETARSLADKLEKVPGAVDVKAGLVETGPEMVAVVDPVRAGRAGLTVSAVADQADAAMFGGVATQLLQGDRQIGVRVRYPESMRSDLKRMSTIPVQAPGGFTLPLGSLARFETVRGSTEVNRENQRRMVSVTGRLKGTLDLGTVMRSVDKMVKETTLPRGVTYLYGGYAQSQKESFNNLLMVLLLAIILVFAVMLFQFGSFTGPTIIMLIMPLSLFGVAVGLAITGTALNVSSLMGAIMLVGIVVKNGILLLDRAKKAEFEGHPPEEAVLIAGRVRLRPILMTTLTAILGLVPLAFGLGAGAQMQKPLAVAVIGGLSFSTLFTLIFAPVIYVQFRAWQELWSPRKVV